MMTLVPLTRCCRMLGIDAKTLREWLKQSQFAVHSHPTDARIRGLSMETLEQVARLHERSLIPDETALLPLELAPSGSDPELIGKLASLEATVATLQQQVTQLALELLQERTRSLLALQAFLGQSQQEHGSPQIPAMLADPACPAALKSQGWLPHPGELRARSRLLPLIEYGADGMYVIIDPVQGELHFLPDSPQWFDWLASLSSFRFEGKRGHLTAYRKGSRSHPSRRWSARRFFHQRHHYHYLGITPHLSIDRLEQVAAALASHIASL